MIDKYIRVLAAVCLVASAAVCAFGASAGGKYTRLINKVQDMPSGRVMEMAVRAAEADHADSALVLCMVVCNRVSDDMAYSEKAECARAFMMTGDIYFRQGDYAGALESYVEGLKLCESCKFHADVPVFLKNIGNVYCVFQDYEKGEEYFRKGYELCRAYKDVDTERKLLVNLTGLCLHLDKVDEAVAWHEAALRLKDGTDFENKFMLAFNGGIISRLRRRYAEASACFRRLASEAVRQGAAPRYVCSAYQELYRVCFETGQRDSAVFYLDKCWHTAVSNGIQHMFVETLKDYSSLYDRAGDTAKAQQYKAAYLTMSDSIFNIRRFDMVKNVQFQYEMSKINTEIATLHARQQSREQVIVFQRILLGAAVAAALLTGFFFVIVYRQKKKLDGSYADLYAVNRKYIDNQEKMRIRHADDLRKIEVLRERLEKVSSAGKEPGVADAGGVHGSEECDKGSRPHGPVCTGRVSLAEAITDVMENTEEFCSADFSLERLASLVSSNSKYVSQEINNTFNKTFRDYVNEYRVSLACKRLVGGSGYCNLTTKAIGESLGYKSHASFINVFRKLTGLTPSQYQKIGKGGTG